MASPYLANIWKMYVLKFFSGMHFMAGVIVPFFLDWGGITFSEIMIIEAWFVFVMFLMEVPTGTIADYFGRKHSLILAGIMGALGCLIFIVEPNFWVFMLGETFWATGAALISGSDEALVYDSLKKVKKQHQSKKILGRFQSAGLFGMLVSAPIGSLVAGAWGSPLTFVLTAGGFFMSSIIALSLKEPKTKTKAESYRYWNILKNGMKYFKSHRILKILAFDVISIGALSFMVFWFYQARLMELDFPLAYFGFIHMGWLVVEIAVANNFALLERLSGSKRNYLFLSALIPGMGFIFMAFSDSIPLLIGVMIIVGSLGYTRPFLFNHYMHKYIESHHRATVMSTVNMIRGFARAVVYILTAVVVTSSLTITLAITGVAILVCALFSKIEEDMLID